MKCELCREKEKFENKELCKECLDDVIQRDLEDEMRKVLEDKVEIYDPYTPY
jgi:hypothetical protein